MSHCRLQRIDRAESGILYFMYEYFSDDKNPENDQNLIPTGVALWDAPAFHKEIYSVLNTVPTVNPTGRIA
ncbi:MAG: hypothetical protein A4E53_03721 [Pelotomaculum sp. PtaB.Bin104]|nr:MAG: hypothetical protein A4E53_03721 [Pelotomaculum sp. PtaB.Bin104]